MSLAIWLLKKREARLAPLERIATPLHAETARLLCLACRLSYEHRLSLSVELCWARADVCAQLPADSVIASLWVVEVALT